jgi:UDP-glucose 4-epimerase
MSTILVTGGAGFIGSNLSDRLLAEGFRVVAVDDLSTGRISNLTEARGYGKDFTFYNMDIRGEGLRTLFERHRPEVVMHLSAQAGVRPSLENPALDASINVLGLINVLEASSHTGVRKVVFASSGGTIYGEPRRLPVKETAISSSHPLSPYGISKKVADDYLRFYHRYRGLDFTALALGNVYGPRQDPSGEAGVISIFVGKMLAGEIPTIYGDGNQTRDFIYVDDVVDAFARAGSRGSGLLMNVGTGVETSVNQLYDAMGAAAGTGARPDYAPARVGELARSALDPGRAAIHLGWKPWTTLPNGVVEVLQFVASRRAEAS